MARQGGVVVLWAVACLILLLLGGCEVKQKPRRPVVPTSGRLFYGGKPAAGAMVFLHPADVEGKQADWSTGYPRAMVGPEGDFRFTTYVHHDGAPSGRYVLVATWNKSARAKLDGDSEAVTDPDVEEDFFEGRFADAETSQVSCVVEGAQVDLGPIELQP